MSYSAITRGYFTFKKCIPEIKRQEIVKDLAKIYSDVTGCWGKEQEVYSENQYDENLTKRILDKATPYLDEFCVEYFGDDSKIWKYELYKDLHRIYWIPGQIVY